MENKAKRGENYMGFLAICLILSFAVCVSSIVRFNLFSIICSMLLVTVNSIAIGAEYGKASVDAPQEAVEGLSFEGIKRGGEKVAQDSEESAK